MESPRVDIWLDPLCPWSVVTAEWLLEVQQHLPLEVVWHVMSLAILNEGQDIPEEWQELARQSWGLHRVLAAGGQDAFVPVMRAVARRWHVEGRRDLPQVVSEAVAEVGLPAELADHASDPEWDAAVRTSHERAMALGGNDVGSPILGFVTLDGEQVGFYGPIIAKVPRGSEAVRVFEATRTLATTTGFFELKRTRDGEPWLE